MQVMILLEFASQECVYLLAVLATATPFLGKTQRVYEDIMILKHHWHMREQGSYSVYFRQGGQ